MPDFPKKIVKYLGTVLKNHPFPTGNRKYAQVRTWVVRWLCEGKILNFLPFSEINTHNYKVVLLLEEIQRNLYCKEVPNRRGSRGLKLNFRVVFCYAVVTGRTCPGNE